MSAASQPGNAALVSGTGAAGSAAGAAHVAIVGGGISGLAAAFFLRDAPVRVTVFEGSPRAGGKLAVSEIAGIDVDEGAESMLARRPEGVELVDAVGLAGDLVSPGTTTAAIWTRGALHPLPGGQVMGVPGDIAALARSGVLSPAGLARAALDLVLPAARAAGVGGAGGVGGAPGGGGDATVASRVGARLGREVVDRLVEPLLGGVYAGRADELSFEATLPALAAASRSHRTLTGAARSMIAASRQGPNAGKAVFTTLAGGLGRLPAAVAAASGAHIRTGAPVRELRRTPGGWQLTVGPASAPEHVQADAVVLALPALPASRLLRDVVPAAAAALGEIEYASMAIVTLAFGRGALGPRPRGSGYLVPAVDGRAVKAVTVSTVKWPHLLAQGPGTGAVAGAGEVGDVVRCSLGRIGEEQVLQRTDEELAALSREELAMAVGVRGPVLAARVTRWGGGLPQYTVGHTGRVQRIRAAVAGQPGLAVCGAAYDGLGIPACVATARQAAAQVLAHLARRPSPHGDEGQ